MSRVAKRPISVPDSVDVILKHQLIIVKGSNKILKYYINDKVKVNYSDNVLTFSGRSKYSDSWIQAGTSRSLVNSMIIGVTVGFFKKLHLSGVGYRVVIKSANLLHLSLGFSHIVIYKLPVEILAESPSPTELVLRSANKQLLGQVAANIRACRIPEPYKGKGIRYDNEVIRIKEAKKK